MSRVVLLDALGTLVGFAAPWPALRDGLAARGVDVSLDDAERAIRHEIGYYRANLHRARDADSLAAVRAECAAVVRAQLPATEALPAAELEAAMLAAFAFRAFPDVEPELIALRDGGATLVVCSNWDVSLHDVLAEAGLTPYLAGVVTSAELGVSKPDPAPFRAALALVGAEPGDALHAGDSVEEDVLGARAAGIAPVLIDRDGVAGAHADVLAGVPVLPTLAGLAAL
jgi:FMN phosphatase YigB (HAD superfamily)